MSNVTRRGWKYNHQFQNLETWMNDDLCTVWGNPGDEKVTGTAKNYSLGTRLVLPDARAYRYVLAGEAAGAGKLCMQAAGVANHDMDLATAVAGTVGDSTITVTLGATLASLNQYQDGYLYVNDGPGEGHIYQIKSNPAADSGASLAVVLAETETVRVALTTANSLCGLMTNPYTSVELFDVNDIDGPCLGVAATDIANAAYGWLQTWGYAAVWSGATVPVLGDPVMPADTAADDGQVEVLDPATVCQTIGVAGLIAPVDTDYGMIFLTIAP